MHVLLGYISVFRICVASKKLSYKTNDKEQPMRKNRQKIAYKKELQSADSDREAKLFKREKFSSENWYLDSSGVRE